MALITIRLPKENWDQIVSDIENMCGCNSDDIEILQGIEILNDTDS
jgi:hypothetical protein